MDETAGHDESAAEPGAPASAPGKKGTPKGRRARTAVYGVYGAFAAAFVLLSTAQIVEQVFGLTVAPLAAPPSAPSPAVRACADEIRALTAALDRGVAATASARSESDALAHLRAAMSPEWDREAAVAAVCGEDSRGIDAWAALLRLRRAEEGAAGRRAVDVGSVRRDVEAYLTGPAPAPPRTP